MSGIKKEKTIDTGKQTHTNTIHERHQRKVKKIANRVKELRMMLTKFSKHNE